MDWVKIKMLHFLYISRMFKDKSLDWITDYYLGISHNVERQDEKTSGIIDHIYKLNHSLTHVIDNIYIGNACNACSYYELQENKVSSIINVTSEIPNYFEEDFDYKKINIRDTAEDNLNIYFDSILDFIDDKQNKNKEQNILIHCYMGSSRSAAIVVLYLIVKHNYDLNKAIKFLKEKRNIVNINLNFINNLKEYIDNNIYDLKV